MLKELHPHPRVSRWKEVEFMSSAHYRERRNRGGADTPSELGVTMSIPTPWVRTMSQRYIYDITRGSGCQDVNPGLFFTIGKGFIYERGVNAFSCLSAHYAQSFSSAYKISTP